MGKPDFEPYGTEWVAELMKLPKKAIIEFYKRQCLAYATKESEIARMKSDLEDSQKVITGLMEENSRIEAERVQGNLDSFEGYKQMQSEINSLKLELKAAEDRIPSKPCAKN